HRPVSLEVAVDQDIEACWSRCAEKAIVRAGYPSTGRVALKGQPNTLAAALVQRFSRTVLDKILIRAVTAEQIGRSHAAKTPVVPVFGGTRRIVRGQIVKRRRYPGLVQVLPERRPFPAEHG